MILPTTYIYYRGDIYSEDSITCYGWIGTNLVKHDECFDVVKKELEKRGHRLIVEPSSFTDVPTETPPTVVIKTTQNGYFIDCPTTDYYHAYFSKEMHCAKACANAVLKVLS
jgi:hypothetical protein